MSIFHAKSYIPIIPYIASGYIREYDISKANINIFYKYGVITKEQYEFYHTVDRNKRQYDMGMLQKDPDKVKILQQGISDAKLEFFKENNILEDDILTIKNDAIYLINKIPNVTKFDNIEFRLANVYTGYYKLNNLELYYYYDIVNDTENLDVKGINSETLTLHDNHFLEFLKVVFNSIQTDGDVTNTLDILITFYTKYINRELDIEYYRTFDSESIFVILTESTVWSYKAYFIDSREIEHIDIGFNLNILRQLMSYVSSMHLYRL